MKSVDILFAATLLLLPVMVRAEGTTSAPAPEPGKRLVTSTEELEGDLVDLLTRPWRFPSRPLTPRRPDPGWPLALGGGTAALLLIAGRWPRARPGSAGAVRRQRLLF